MSAVKPWDPTGRHDDRQPVLPNWARLHTCEIITSAWSADLRIDTGDFRVWTSRCGLADGEPFAHTVYVEALDDGRWLDLGHYDGDDPPRSLPGFTPHALRGEL